MNLGARLNQIERALLKRHQESSDRLPRISWQEWADAAPQRKADIYAGRCGHRPALTVEPGPDHRKQVYRAESACREFLAAHGGDYDALSDEEQLAYYHIRVEALQWRKS